MNLSTMTIAALSGALAAGQITLDAFSAEVERRTSAKPVTRLTAKITEKGGVSVYGLNARFPVTLYADQWERLHAAYESVVAPLVAKAPRKPVAVAA